MREEKKRRRLRLREGKDGREEDRRYREGERETRRAEEKKGEGYSKKEGEEGGAE